MTTLYPTIGPVNARYGAPMGRDTYDNVEIEGDLLLFRVPLDAGGYDAGGAYWGAPDNLWCATDAFNFRTFTRADSFADAAGKITSLYSFAQDFKPLGPSDFFAGYATTALWVERFEDEDADLDLTFLDAGYGISDLTPEAQAKMLADCERFLAEAASIIARIPDFNYYRAGNVLWFVRQGHGIGWWDDAIWGGLEDELSKVAEGFGQEYLYLTENNKVDLQ